MCNGIEQKASVTTSRGKAIACIKGYCSRHGLEWPANGIGIHRLVRRRPENWRKKIGLYLAQHDIAVGDRQRAAPPIAGRPGVGARRVGSDTQPGAVEMQESGRAHV